MAKQKRNRKSPATDAAIEWLNTEGNTSAADLMVKFGISKATAYNAIKKFKQSVPDPVVISEPKPVKKEEVIVARPKKRAKKVAPPKKGDKKYGITPMDEIPERLRRLPRLTLEGFSLAAQSKSHPENIEWADRVYVSACPCCTEKVNTFKRMIDRVATYTGVCKTCDIRVTISRD